jgi:toxin ParE1/3/4
MQLEISRDAAEDMRELHGYGAQKYGLRHADAYLRELFDAFDHIARWPYAARERRAKASALRLHRQRAHNILYAVENDTVSILRVFHHSVNWIDLL